MIDDGQTFHKVFYVRDKNMKESVIVSMLRKNALKDDVDLIVVDEASMTSAEYLVLLDSRLRLIHDASEPFEGKHVLFSGDYLQMACTFGTPLCHAMYITTTTEKNECKEVIFYVQGVSHK